MLIQVITFEIRDYSNNLSWDFAVRNTPENYELIASHRHTRNIVFDSMFDFEFDRKECMPQFMIDVYEMQKHEFEYELDEIDEMVGVY